MITSHAIASSLKSIIFLALFGSLLTACASNSTQDQDTDIQEPTVVATPIDQAPTEVVDEPIADLLETVFYFDFDQSTLKAATRAALDAQAARLRTTDSNVRLEGHADERGTREYNMALGERRAKAVSRFLTVQGAGSNQIEVVSYGEERPAMMGHDEGSWSQNRRVELKYSH